MPGDRRIQIRTPFGFIAGMVTEDRGSPERLGRSTSNLGFFFPLSALLWIEAEDALPGTAGSLGL